MDFEKSWQLPRSTKSSNRAEQLWYLKVQIFMFFLWRCFGQISRIIHQNTSILYDTMCWKAFYFLHCRLLWMFPWLSVIFFGHNGLTSDDSDDPTWLACFLFDWPFVPRRTSHVDRVPPHTMSHSTREVIWILFSDAQSHSQWELKSLRRIGKLNQFKRIVCQTQPIYIKVVRRHGI